LLDTDGERKALDDRHVMPRPIRIRPEAVHHQCSKRALHDGFLSCIEARFSTDASDVGITKIPLGRRKELLDLASIRRVGLKLPYLQ
jgi:hypothetical protein